MGLMRDAMRSRALARWILLLSGVGISAALVVGVAVGWTAALVLIVAIALGVAAGQVYLYVSLHGRFDALDHLANEAVVVLDDGDRVLYASPSAESILGAPVTQLHGWSTDLVHPDDLERLTLASEQARRARGGSFLETFRIRHPSKGWRYIEVAASNRLDDPKIAGMVCTLRDITDRIAAEQAMRASERALPRAGGQPRRGPADLRCRGPRHVREPVARTERRCAARRHHRRGPHHVPAPRRRGARRTASSSGCAPNPTAPPPSRCACSRSDGDYIEVEAGLQNLLANPAVAGVVIHARDVTARNEAERGRRGSRRSSRTRATSSS